jgi:cytochrome c556
MKYYLIVLTAAALSVGGLSVCPSSGQKKKPSEQEKASVWMKKKLEFSQNILAGLTESDFAKVRANAEAMSFLGYLEKWTRGDQPDYKKQIVFFDFANRELIRQAKEKNLDGATLAYNQLTVSCVQCHKIVRNAKK